MEDRWIISHSTVGVNVWVDALDEVGDRARDDAYCLNSLLVDLDFTNVNWSSVSSNMEWVKTIWINKHKWLLSWIVDASEGALFDVAALDFTVLAKEDKLAVEDKWCEWHFKKVATLRVWWWNTADYSILEISESKLASVAENFLRWFVVSIGAHERALLAAVNLFTGSFHNAVLENVVISDVTAHSVGHWAFFHDGDWCQIWALALVTSHQVEAEGSWVAHVASVVALVDVDASSDAHTVTAVALWA